ncbi:MAG: putative lipid II flippase FtsW [Microbacteriaceae bacterium]|nr:putative lipid II flippase FtsW [Microbacteriaceae bacterium]MCI1207398.1 putative lipid II flippase FtsW [Microbacteriaceae bacterium]
MTSTESPLPGTSASDAGAPPTQRLRLGRSRASVPRLYGQVLGLVTLLVVFGLAMVLSSTSIGSYAQTHSFFSTFSRQATLAVVGYVLMLIVSRLRIETLYRYTNLLFLVALFLQLLTVIGLGQQINGNRNWLAIGPIQFQPSELLKAALILWMAREFTRLGPGPFTLRALAWPLCGGVLAALLLIVKGGDLGTTVIVAMICAGVFLVAKVPWKYLLSGVVLVALGALALALGGGHSRGARIQAWLKGGDCSDYTTTCWQSSHGKWALANGGLFGVGLGNSKSKWAWLPEAGNDFIFAVIGEELGMIGALALILLFLGLAVLLVRAIARTHDRFSTVILTGGMVWIVGQAFVNISVVLGLLPVLGVPLPFISSGGSALLVCLLMVGAMLAVIRKESDVE